MIHFSIYSFLTVHKGNEEICLRDIPNLYLVFGLIDINPNNNVNKINLNVTLII